MLQYVFQSILFDMIFMTIAMLFCLFIPSIRASDISRKKKQNFAGFSGANSRKNRPISPEKSQNSLKDRPISRDFRGRKVKIRRKIGRFHGILAEKVKFRRIFGANS